MVLSSISRSLEETGLWYEEGKLAIRVDRSSCLR